MKQSLSPKELAQVIGVSESSLKRWADGGRLRVNRTMGGHRRITIQEAVRFAREAQLPIVRPELLGISSVGRVAVQHRGVQPEEAARLLEKFLFDGKAEEARGLLLDLYFRGKSVAWLCDGPIRSAMTELGEVWKHESRGIYIEHRAMDICLNALNQLRLLLAEPTLEDAPISPEAGSGRPLALGAAPANDPYILGSLMSACVCVEAGYRDVNLGANLPLGSLIEAAQRYQPRLVWLSCSHREAVPTPDEIDNLAQTLTEINARLIVGGQALPRGNGGSENVVACGNMGELHAFARGLLSA
ncbi:MAG: hypothetical protein AAGG38_05660 [Planctomycetota bacterium]